MTEETENPKTFKEYLTKLSTPEPDENPEPEKNPEPEPEENTEPDDE